MQTNTIEEMARSTWNRQLDTAGGEAIESMEYRRGRMRGNRGRPGEQACSHDIAAPALRHTSIPVDTRRNE